MVCEFVWEGCAGELRRGRVKGGSRLAWEGVDVRECSGGQRIGMGALNNHLQYDITS